MNSKDENGFTQLLVFLVGILIISSAVVGGVFIFKNTLVQNPQAPASTPTPTIVPRATPTIDTIWKAYSNPNLGIELQYPSDFELNTTQRPSDLKLHNFSFGTSTVHEGESVLFLKKNIDMDINPNDVQGEGAMTAALFVNDIVIDLGNIDGVSGKADLDKIVKDFFSFEGGYNDSRLIEPIMIAGKQGYKVASYNKESMMIYNIIFPGKDEKILYLDITVLPYTDPHSPAVTGASGSAELSPRYLPNNEIVNKIISTIKII